MFPTINYTSVYRLCYFAIFLYLLRSIMPLLLGAEKMTNCRSRFEPVNRANCMTLLDANSILPLPLLAWTRGPRALVCANFLSPLRAPETHPGAAFGCSLAPHILTRGVGTSNPFLGHIGILTKVLKQDGSFSFPPWPSFDMSIDIIHLISST